MSKFVTTVMRRFLPKASGKAATIQGKCYSGCGGDGVWIASGAKRPANGKLPCC
jgi:hypothetical protein